MKNFVTSVRFSLIVLPVLLAFLHSPQVSCAQEAKVAGEAQADSSQAEGKLNSTLEKVAEIAARESASKATEADERRRLESSAIFQGDDVPPAPRRELSEEDARILSSARSLSRAFQRASEIGLPSVVKILSKTKSADEESSVLDIIGGDDAQVFDSVGSGVIVSADGLILTNHHVVRDATRIEVRLHDGREFEVVDIKSDPNSDVAIIKIAVDEALPAAVLADSDDIYVGEWVIAIGSPFMLDASVSAGIISSVGRRRRLSRSVEGVFLQTDAAINPGNSGGPLLDLEGRVVGINTAISSRNGGFQGIGFAIPISRASWIKGELLEFGKVRRARIGVGTSDVPYSVAKQLNLPRSSGALVNSVVPYAPAALAGLKTGDIVLSFDGQIVESAAQFADTVQQSPIGQPLPIKILRNGEQLELSVTLVERR